MKRKGLGFAKSSLKEFLQLADNVREGLLSAAALCTNMYIYQKERNVAIEVTMTQIGFKNTSSAPTPCHLMSF